MKGEGGGVMKPGDLIRFYNYIDGKESIGLLIKRVPKAMRRGQWYDIIVLCNGKEVGWVSWQCEVWNGNR